MKPKVLEHTLSILLVTAVFGVIALVLREGEIARSAERAKAVQAYLDLDFLDLDDPMHRVLLKETLNVFDPGKSGEHDLLLKAIERYRQEQFTSVEYKTGGDRRGLTGRKLVELGGMYAQFVLIYVLVMVLTYRASQSIAVARFVKMKQLRSSYVRELFRHIATANFTHIPAYTVAILLLVKALAKGVAYAILFAPAYVIAYSIRSTFDTGSYLFMIVLGIVSNGLLITYANRFYTFLVGESRKGYVQTALVKNLDDDYQWGTARGVPHAAVLRPGHMLPGHVFSHVYRNARYQYIPTLKEHASFLITGLIIIEMALNIHGHLGYEMLQNILYRQYDVVAFIIVAIFLLVKATEMVVDVWYHREMGRYENK